jgi:hypothetical protein
MNTKLTLTIDDTIIQQAKKYAKRKESSLSNIVENYLKVLVSEKKPSETELTPIVKSLKSSFSAEPDFDYKKELTKKLSEKYL